MQSPQDETLTHVFLTHFSQRFLKQNYPKNISDVPSKILEKKEHNYQISPQVAHITLGPPVKKLAMNNRRLLIAAEFHFVHPVEKDSINTLKSYNYIDFFILKSP